MKNIKTVKITIPNEIILKRLKSTPALSRLSRLELKIGDNFENVNHSQFSEMLRMYPLINVNITEL